MSTAVSGLCSCFICMWIAGDVVQGSEECAELGWDDGEYGGGGVVTRTSSEMLGDEIKKTIMCVCVCVCVCGVYMCVWCVFVCGVCLCACGVSLYVCSVCGVVVCVCGVCMCVWCVFVCVV